VSIFDFTKLHVPVSFFARGMAAVLAPAQPHDACDRPRWPSVTNVYNTVMTLPFTQASSRKKNQKIGENGTQKHLNSERTLLSNTDS
jgi:hypothetical protein